MVLLDNNTMLHASASLLDHFQLNDQSGLYNEHDFHQAIFPEEASGETHNGNGIGEHAGRAHSPIPDLGTMADFHLDGHLDMNFDTHEIPTDFHGNGAEYDDIGHFPGDGHMQLDHLAFDNHLDHNLYPSNSPQHMFESHVLNHIVSHDDMHYDDMFGNSGLLKDQSKQKGAIRKTNSHSIPKSNNKTTKKSQQTAGTTTSTTQNNKKRQRSNNHPGSLAHGFATSTSLKGAVGNDNGSNNNNPFSGPGFNQSMVYPSSAIHNALQKGKMTPSVNVHGLDHKPSKHPKLSVDVSQSMIKNAKMLNTPGSNRSITSNGTVNTPMSKPKQTSYFRGVSCCGKDRKWQARIRDANRVRYLGRYPTEVEAALIYDRAARECKGANASTNFIIMDHETTEKLKAAFVQFGEIPIHMHDLLAKGMRPRVENAVKKRNASLKQFNAAMNNNNGTNNNSNSAVQLQQRQMVASAHKHATMGSTTAQKHLINSTTQKHTSIASTQKHSTTQQNHTVNSATQKHINQHASNPLTTPVTQKTNGGAFFNNFTTTPKAATAKKINSPHGATNPNNRSMAVAKSQALNHVMNHGMVGHFVNKPEVEPKKGATIGVAGAPKSKALVM